MKGLIIKDIKFLKNQKAFVVIIFFVAALLMFTSNNASAVITYVTFVLSMVVAGTLTYDEYDNGYAFLFSLPVTRKTYVKEKYLFCLLCSLVFWVAATGIAIIYSSVKDSEKEMFTTLVVAGCSLVILTTFLSVLLPAQLKFGAEKGRIAMLVVLGIFFLLIYGGVKILKARGVDLDAVLEGFSRMSWIQLGVGAAVVCGAMYAGSYLLSIRIMEGKEF